MDLDEDGLLVSERTYIITDPEHYRVPGHKPSNRNRLYLRKCYPFYFSSLLSDLPPQASPGPPRASQPQKWIVKEASCCLTPGWPRQAFTANSLSWAGASWCAVPRPNSVQTGCEVGALNFASPTNWPL